MIECRTDGTSAFNTRTVQRRLLLLDPERGEGEVDGDPAARRRGGGCSGSPAGLRRASAREREVLQERREAPKAVCCCPPSPPLYRPPGGAPALEMGSQGGSGGQRGEGVALPPKARGKSPHPRVCNPRRMGEGPWGAPSPLGAGSLPLSAHGALRDRWPHPVDPRDPSGGPGTIPVTPETFPVAET